MKLRKVLRTVCLSLSCLTSTAIISCSNNEKSSESINNVTITIKYVCGNETFKTYNESVAKDKTYIPKTPSLDNYEFVAWYSDIDLDILLDDDFAPNENTTIYAKFKEIKKSQIEKFSTKDTFDFTFTIDLANYTKPEKNEVYDDSKSSIIYSYMSNVNLNNESQSKQYTNKTLSVKSKKVEIDAKELTLNSSIENDNFNNDLNFIYDFNTHEISVSLSTTNTLSDNKTKYDYTFSLTELTSTKSENNYYKIENSSSTYDNGTIHNDNETKHITSTTNLSNAIIVYKENDEIVFTFSFVTTSSLK